MGETVCKEWGNFKEKVEIGRGNNIDLKQDLFHQAVDFSPLCQAGN